MYIRKIMYKSLVEIIIFIIIIHFILLSFWIMNEQAVWAKYIW